MRPASQSTHGVPADKAPPALSWSYLPGLQRLQSVAPMLSSAAASVPELHASHLRTRQEERKAEVRAVQADLSIAKCHKR
jgi:hypothetical protein